MNISKILYDLRTDNDISIKELAEKFNIDRKTIWRIETKRFEPKIDTLIMYAKFFNVSLDYICGLTETRRTLDGRPYTIKNMTQINGNNNKVTNIKGNNNKINIKNT